MVGSYSDTCDASGQCSSVPDGSCCSDDGQCDDGDPCTTDLCGADGQCAHLPSPDCCVVDGDCVPSCQGYEGGRCDHRE